MCVCVRERERERDRDNKENKIKKVTLSSKLKETMRERAASFLFICRFPRCWTVLLRVQTTTVVNG